MEARRRVELTGTNCSIGLVASPCVLVSKPIRVSPSDQTIKYCYRFPAFFSADLVVMAGVPHPIPSRTRPLSPPAPMVLRLKTWESRSLPGPQRRTDMKIRLQKGCQQVPLLNETSSPPGAKIRNDPNVLAVFLSLRYPMRHRLRHKKTQNYNTVTRDGAVR